jgi:predicted 3-demethylubiquinone-9 3-methyltransferase (glyoxalase superfamily)
MQTIATCLWFDDNAEEAVGFYVSLFEGARVTGTTRYPEGAPGPAGSVLTITFELAGQRFVALNGGPRFTFSPAMSIVARCVDQAEIDRLWDRLSEGGEQQRCGWLVDRFGVSWQIEPSDIDELLSDDDPARAQRVMKAILAMDKLDVQAIRDAARPA